MKGFTRVIICVICIVFINFTESCAEDLNIDLNDINTYIADIKGVEIDFDTVIETIRNGRIAESLTYLKDTLLNSLKSTVVNHNRIMYTIIGVCLISVVLRSSASDIYSEFYGQILVCAVSFVMIDMYSHYYMLIKDVISNLAGFMKVSMPLYFAISASLTDKLPFSVYGVFMSFVSLFHYGTLNLILPALTISVILGISENLNIHFDTSSVRKFINTTVNWLLGLYTTLFAAILKITHIAAYGTDKLVMHGIKYTLARSIPVVGGFMSEIAGAVITSTLILHNSVGIGCVILVALISMVPFVIVFTISCVLKFIASLMNCVAHKKICNIIMCFGDCLCELSIVLLCGTVSFMIGIGIQLSAGM